MTKELLEKIRNKYHNGIKREAAKAIKIKEASYGHYSNGTREMRFSLLKNIIEKYSIRNTPNGLTDTQIVDLLLK